MSTLVINGYPHVTCDKYVEVKVRRGLVIINNEEVFHNSFVQHGLNITVSGEIDHLEIDARNVISVRGDYFTSRNVQGGVETKDGKVEIGGNVNGHVKTESGDIICKGNINGDVYTVSGKVIKDR